MNTQTKGRPERHNHTLITNTKIFLNRCMEIAEKKIVIFQTQDKYRNTVVNNSYQND